MRRLLFVVCSAIAAVFSAGAGETRVALVAGTDATDMAKRTQRMHDAKWGVFNHYTKYADFTSGEFNDFYWVPKERFIEGAQAFALIPLN